MNPYYRLIKTHAGYEIYIRSTGFEPMINAFGKVTSFLLRQPQTDKVALFAFAYSGLDALAQQLSESDLIDKAIKVIEHRVDENLLSFNNEYTFEYESGEYVEKLNAPWWVKTTA